MISGRTGASWSLPGVQRVSMATLEQPHGHAHTRDEVQLVLDDQVRGRSR